MVEPAKVPAGLGKSGRSLWRSVAQDVADQGLELDSREHRFLRDACKTADDLNRIEAILADADLVVKGSMGQPAPNGLLAEARAARAQISSLLKLIDVSAAADETAKASPRQAALKRHYGSISGQGARHGA